MDLRKIVINKLVQGIVAFVLLMVFSKDAIPLLPIKITLAFATYIDVFLMIIGWIVLGLIIDFCREVVYKGEILK